LSATTTEFFFSVHTGGLSGQVIVAPNNAYGNFTSTTNAPPFGLTVATGTTPAPSAMGNFLLESTNVYWASSQSNNLLYAQAWRDKVNAN